MLRLLFAVHDRVIPPKRRADARALYELGPLVHPEGLPVRPRWWPKRWRAVFDKDIRKLEAGAAASEKP